MSLPRTFVWLLVLLLLLPGGAAAQVRDSVWSRSQPWLTFNNAAPGERTVRVALTDLAIDCIDPVVTRGLPARTMCYGVEPGRVQVIVHVFDEASGRELPSGNGVLVPLACADTTQCEQTFLLPHAGRFALLIHGGQVAAGHLRGRVSVTAGDPAPETLLPATDIDFAGDVVMLLPDRSRGPYDVISVLVPDGPILNTAGDQLFPGNDLNDFLGADATEVWVLDARYQVLTGDVAQTGLGAAGSVRGSRSRQSRRSRGGL